MTLPWTPGPDHGLRLLLALVVILGALAAIGAGLSR